jgi:hypothetical protein
MCPSPSNSERTRRVTRCPASTSQIGSLHAARTRASSTGDARFRCGLGSSSIRRREPLGLKRCLKRVRSPLRLHELVIQLKVAVWQNEPKIINVFRDAQRWLREERRTIVALFSPALPLRAWRVAPAARWRRAARRRRTGRRRRIGRVPDEIFTTRRRFSSIIGPRARMHRNRKTRPVAAPVKG